MPDQGDIDRLRAQFTDELARAGSDRDLRQVRDKYLGRKSGAVAALMKAVGTAPPDTRPLLGRLANELKREVEERVAERESLFASARPPVNAVDITLPGRLPAIGHRHPLTIVRERIEGIFTRMGFTILDGPEVEDEYHNFEALNMPPEHPARDMQDTLYLDGGIRPARATGAPEEGAGGSPATLLRTHTSGMQIRYMERHEPPVRIIAPGRVYRRDNPDLTHTPMFQQVEGLVVGENVSMADLKGTLAGFVRELFDDRTPVRFRPSFFPYTEPSAEVDIGCIFCRGAGCAVCKRSGWLEILGSGMVHPAVFEAVGYDAERYTGFAFGMGIERVAILKYGVDDIRMFYDNDLRFLEQFPV
jgi:phenylalanyl-tRNA synthetase alpha chain